MSGEGATLGLIGKLPPLPLSVLHNPPDIRSAIHSYNISSYLSLFQVVSSISRGSIRRISDWTTTREKGTQIEQEKREYNRHRYSYTFAH